MLKDRTKPMLKTRVISALLGVAGLLFILSMGGIYWQSFFVLLGIIALYEFYMMMAKTGHKALFIPGYFLLLLLMGSVVYPLYLSPGLYLVMFMVVVYAVLSYPRISIVDIALSLLGPAYIGFFLSFALKVSELEPAFVIILLAFILTWSSDVGGYAFGMLWGRHKMAPLLSPGKSWEGAFGALLLTTIMAFVFLKVFELEKPGFAYVLILAVLASVAAQFGDLFISSMKRYFGVKDTGNIIPGHGGVLDRFDAFLLVVPLVYYFFR